MKCANCLYTGNEIPHPIDGRASSGVQCFGVRKGSGLKPLAITAAKPAVLALVDGVMKGSAMPKAVAPTAIDPDDPHGTGEKRSSWRNAKFRNASARDTRSRPTRSVRAQGTVPESTSPGRTDRTRSRGKRGTS